MLKGLVCFESCKEEKPQIIYESILATRKGKYYDVVQFFFYLRRLIKGYECINPTHDDN